MASSAQLLRQDPIVNMRARRVPVSNFNDVIEQLRRHVENGKADPAIRAIVAEALADVPERDYRKEIEALFHWVREHVRYTRDPHGIDTFQSPRRTVQLGIGDCDDMATLLASMLQSAGYDVCFRVVDSAGNGWDHIYVIAGYPPGNPQHWIALDPTVDRAPGWEVSGVKRKRDFCLGGARPVSGLPVLRIDRSAPGWAWLFLLLGVIGLMRILGVG